MLYQYNNKVTGYLFHYVEGEGKKSRVPKIPSVFRILNVFYVYKKVITKQFIIPNSETLNGNLDF